MFFDRKKEWRYAVNATGTIPKIPKTPKKNFDLSIFSRWFHPNAVLPSRSMLAITAVHILIAIGFWFLTPSSVFPKPSEILAAINKLWYKDAIGREIITSMILNFHAMSIALFLSLALSYLTALPFFRRIIDFVSYLRFLGLTGLTLIFTQYTSGSHSLKVSILVFSVSVYYVTTLVRIIKDIPKSEYDYAKTLGLSDWGVVWEIIVRGRAADMLEAFRQNAAMGWMMLTAVEGISKTEGGVGTLLLNSQRFFRLDEVYAIQIMLWTLGLLQDRTLVWIRLKLFPFADLTLVKK